MPQMMDHANDVEDDWAENVEIALANATFENLTPEGRKSLLESGRPHFREAIEHPDPVVRQAAARRILAEYLGLDEPGAHAVREPK